MSLFVGNLSDRTRGDDLHYVFRKFGQCSLNLKARYGFVVYAFPQNAERALRVLQGRYICGEPLVLAWSKKQRIPFRGHQRVVRYYEGHSGRGRDFACRRMSSNDRRDYRLDGMQPDTDGEKLNSVDLSNGDRAEPQKYDKDDNREHHDLGEGVLNDGVTDAAKLVDIANRIDNEGEFDWYELSVSHEREDKHESRQMAYSGCGSVPQTPHENARTVKNGDTTLNCFNDLKSRNSCFSCGDFGHKIRDCPSKYSSGRKPTRFEHRKDDSVVKSSGGEAELERCQSMSWEKLRLNKDSASGYRKRKRESVTKETDRSEIKDHGGKKRSKWEGKSPKRHSAKKARSLSSPPSSDYPASKSCSASKSSKSESRCSNSRARSKAVSMRAKSLSSDSRSSSKSISSKSRSRSSSFTSSSESLSKSSYKAHVDLNCPVYKAKAPISKGQPIGGDAWRVQNPGPNAAWCSSPGGLKEKIDPGNSGGLVINQLKEPASEKHVKNSNGRPSSISSEEMCMALKHYGMEPPEESEKHLPIEEYLGSARLWPWEIIYYRRLKKGLVSVENYARRVSQNKEFGIIDKYVRSSSGWGETDQESPSKAATEVDLS